MQHGGGGGRVEKAYLYLYLNTMSSISHGNNEEHCSNTCQFNNLQSQQQMSPYNGCPASPYNFTDSMSNNISLLEQSGHGSC